MEKDYKTSTCDSNTKFPKQCNFAKIHHEKTVYLRCKVNIIIAVSGVALGGDNNSQHSKIANHSCGKLYQAFAVVMQVINTWL